MNIIIPVYNAACFVEIAVLSALEQAETVEVILVEDGSKDHSLIICQQLSEQHDKVFCFQHPNGINRGAGASRNLGIHEAKSEWIAFLDADDYFLPNRFQFASTILDSHPDAEGVYEAIGVDYYSEQAQLLYEQYGGATELTTVRNPNIHPNQLFTYLITQPRERFHLNALILRKELANRINGFNETLKQTQDTDFIWRVALQGKLYPGLIDQPIAMRRVHIGNRILNREEALRYRRFFANLWFDRMLEEDWSKAINRAIFRRKLDSIQQWFSSWNSWYRVPVKMSYALYLFIRYPRLWEKIFSSLRSH